MLRAGLKEQKNEIHSTDALEDYNDMVRTYRKMASSCNGMDVEFWGPPLWRSWHAVAANYSTDRKPFYVQFEKSLAGLLPCASCRSNFSETLEQVKAKMLGDPYKNRMEYFYYVYLVHDAVNAKLNKASPPFKEVVDAYEKHRAD
jgi:hypothetical protein